MILAPQRHARLVGHAAPEIVGITGWVRGPPVTLRSLRGSVVLVEFWTHGCGNCVRSVPFVQRWQDILGASGFQVVGIHTPEFDDEKDSSRVDAAMRRLGVEFPVGLDNEMATWKAYQNQYWPCGYLVDRRGVVRDVFVGEGQYAQREARIRTLLAEPL
jgi:thiol-disulfide isomerase/thioredoxin